MKKRHISAIVISGALLVLGTAGCGGSNNGSTSIKPSTTLTTETPGYTWNYTITGEAIPTAGGTAEPVTGTAQATVTNAVVNGSTLALALTTNISVNGGTSYPISITYYVAQNDTGDIIEYAISHTDSSGTVTHNVTSPSLANSEIFPGTFTQGETIGETINYNGGSSDAYSLEVVQPVEVTTTAGNFATWQANVVDDGEPLGTQYWDPAMGMFVKGNINAQAYLGATQYNLSVNYSLTSTSGGVPTG